MDAASKQTKMHGTELAMHLVKRQRQQRTGINGTQNLKDLSTVTFHLNRLTKTETSIIHLNLVGALAVAQIIFLTGIEATQNKVNIEVS